MVTLGHSTPSNFEGRGALDAPVSHEAVRMMAPEEAMVGATAPATYIPNSAPAEQEPADPERATDNSDWPKSTLSDAEAAALLRGADSGVCPLLNRRGYRTAKRIIDIVVSSAAIVVLLIPGALLSAAICIKSPGAGPLYSQMRVWRVRSNGAYRLFRMWKFRSMVPHADEMLADLQDANEADGPLFKIKDDPRVIPGIGQFIRKHSIDELPQLLNVFAGQIPLRILKTRPEFSEKSMGAFALPAKSSTNKGKAFSQVVSCFANGLRMRRISKFNCNRIRGMEAQFLAKPVFGAVCA